MSRRLQVPLVAVLCLGAVSACDAAPSAPLPEKPNILLVSVDTLRADQTSADGYARETTPFLAGLAAEGVRFERAYATSSWTVPSVTAMLTGTYRHGMGQRLRGGDRTWAVIPETLPNLAEMLRGRGYSTFGLSANTNVPAERGFSRGFDRFECIGSVDRDRVEAALAPWLEEIGRSAPWFLWIHMFDPHGPYRGRAPWAAEFDPATATFGWVDGMSTETWSQRAAKLPRPVVEAVRALYDSEIRDADEYLRLLFERLPAAQQAVFLFTSDHGEEFLEHGGTLHGATLYDESIRIPLVVRFPDRRHAGTVVRQAVSLVDVLPTIAGAAGVEPAPANDGIDLFGADGPAVPQGRIVFSENLRGDRGSILAVTDGRFKLIVDDARGSSLYDLQKDPGELHDVSAAQGSVVARFQTALAEFEERHTGPAEDPRQTPVTPETIERLKSLGYVDK
jgi:arylsulfatase A-like enzyme